MLTLVFILIAFYSVTAFRVATTQTYTANLKEMIRNMPFKSSSKDDELFSNAGANMPEMPPPAAGAGAGKKNENNSSDSEEDDDDDAVDNEFSKGFDEETRKKLKKLAQTFRRKIKQTYRGYDLRPSDKPTDSNDNEMTTDDAIFDYVESFRKKDLLDKLQDPNITNVEKLRLLGEKRFLYDEF